jgi:CBS domain-containing protein
VSEPRVEGVHLVQINRIATMVVETASTHDTAETAARKMKASHVGFLPVVEEDRLVGVLTDRDIATRVIAEGQDSRFTHVGAIMSTPARWNDADAEHETACRIMMDYAVRGLVVCNEQLHPIGVLSIDDLALFGQGDETVGRVLDAIVGPALVENILG